MKRAILAAMICGVIAGVAIGADPPKQKKAVTPTKKVAPTTAPSHATPLSSATKKGTASPPGHTGTPAKTPNRTTASRRYYGRRTYTPQQTSPTPDRYREIQDALAAKGYLKTPSSGVWDKDSMDAMQRFQQDQNLEPTGKLTAKSLGALGLGPKTPMATNANSNHGEASPLQ
jgi:hypothetical protein